MKLSHLSLAIFAAISLAACGGSSNGNQVTPDENQTQPQPQPTPETPEGNEALVDPTGDEVVTNFDVNTASSQGGIQYLRNEDSRFDRGNNPEKPASATSLLGVNLNDQNPWFTNYVAARTPFAKDGKSVTVAQYLGTRKTGQDGLDSNDPDSLQVENAKNIARLMNASGNAQTDINPVSADQVKTDLKNLKGLYDDYVKALKDLKKSETFGENGDALPSKAEKKEIDEAIAAAAAQYNELKKLVLAEAKLAPTIELTIDNNAQLDDTDDGSSLDQYDDNQIVWGDGVAADANNPATGLVGMNFLAQDENGKNITTGDGAVRKEVQGTDDASLSTTRIFGRYFLSDDQPDNRKAAQRVTDGNFNSYRKAATFAVQFDSLGNLLDGDQDVTADNLDKDQLKTEHEKTAYGIGVEPMELVNVQYGRVTGQLDPVDEPVDENVFKVGGNTTEERAPFLGRNNPDAVNYYFYRGTNATTVDQMAALPADGILEYRGHALMYGIDNRYHGGSQNLPNSFGDTGSLGLGNFVVARYNVGQAEVGGIVYNAWQLDNTADNLTVDPLVKFSGDVKGNSVVGSANLAYKQAAPADFRGSFFGDKAQEFGGSFNSTTWGEKYGPGEGNEIWGGVFGAQRVVEEVQTNVDNAWLGDIGANVRK